mmetsp:Transcript_90120/g.215261  ORF Transcript_90120/g.215261 Transcript_90120/m.215261 type:complete len:261 (-) Transcript_90120:697-1479(-)
MQLRGDDVHAAVREPGEGHQGVRHQERGGVPGLQTQGGGGGAQEEADGHRRRRGWRLRCGAGGRAEVPEAAQGDGAHAQQQLGREGPSQRGARAPDAALPGRAREGGRGAGGGALEAPKAVRGEERPGAVAQRTGGPRRLGELRARSARGEPAVAQEPPRAEAGHGGVGAAAEPGARLQARLRRGPQALGRGRRVRGPHPADHRHRQVAAEAGEAAEGHREAAAAGGPMRERGLRPQAAAEEGGQRPRELSTQQVTGGGS